MPTKKSDKPNKLELHRQKIKDAMPDVKAVVSTHSLSIVNACIHNLYEQAKLKRKADDLRKQIQEIEGKL